MTSLSHLLKGREFLSIATADRSGGPNAAPKFLLKFEKPFIYLVDYTIAKTVENLRANPRASVSFMDLDNLEGYRLNGPAELIEKGEEFERASEDLNRKLIRLSADRVIEGSRTGKKHKHFELEIPDRFIIIKFTVEEIARIGTRGDLYKESGSSVA